MLPHLLVAASMLASVGVGCGSDREERGLTPSVESASPVSSEEMRMTEKERREKEAREDDAAAREKFGEE
jgi:hypothetical protein